MSIIIALEIEYDGAKFHGFQLQPSVRTVQSELQRVLSIVTREVISTVHCAGRTDAGVHARGQIVSFAVSHEPDLERLALAVSGLLKGEVAALRAARMLPPFHPRGGVIGKTYVYRIVNRRTPLVRDYGCAWHVPGALDLARMQSEADEFLGTHDFTSFRASGCTNRTPIKRIDSCVVESSGSEISVSVTGSGFLKQMVRTMVGTLVDRAKLKNAKLKNAKLKNGGLSESIADIIEFKDRQKAGVTAPAHGLTLQKIQYRNWPAIDEWRASCG